jgi:ADP-heptose:LPS heptosyltransferase
MKSQGTIVKLSRLLARPKQLSASVQFHAGRLVYPRYKRPLVVLFRYTRALGDNLMLTTVAREVRRRNPGAVIHVVTGLPEIFERNPDVDFVSAEPSRPVPGIGRYLIRYEQHFPWSEHLLRYCVGCVDINDEIELRTYIFPSEADRTFAARVVGKFEQAPVLVSREAGPRTDKKNWPISHWNELVLRLLRKRPVFDIGGKAVPPLGISHPNYLSLTGRTSIHQSAALMERAGLLITPVTGTLHLAAACGLPTLTIVGGSEPAVATQYPASRSMVNRPSCADCYENGPCRSDFACLWNIRPEDVYAEAASMLDCGETR